MPSLVAWLDASVEEQRRAREIMALFAQPESRDELGIGQIRDVFSDLLFPGTSVIQTRARYFFFVPWIFQDGERRHLGGGRLTEWAHNQERRLVETLRKAGEVEGLIGRRAGPTVKILPSSIYWTGLERFGILSEPGSPEQVIRRLASGATVNLDADELADRVQGVWHATLPKAPPGFSSTVDGGFALTSEEAHWLRERLLETEHPPLRRTGWFCGRRRSIEARIAGCVIPPPSVAGL